jgi:hypothetical protein
VLVDRGGRKDDDSKSGRVSISLHIRRGDQFHFAKGNIDYLYKRFLPNAAHLSILRSLLAHLTKLGRPRTRLFLHCEDMLPDMSVLDVEGDYTDFRQQLADFDVDIVPGSAEGVQAFDEMCHSDFLLTAKSGLGTLVGVLCDHPILLAAPYFEIDANNCIPNAIRLVENGTSKYNLTVPFGRASSQVQAIPLVSSFRFPAKYACARASPALWQG